MVGIDGTEGYCIEKRKEMTLRQLGSYCSLDIVLHENLRALFRRPTLTPLD